MVVLVFDEIVFPFGGFTTLVIGWYVCLKQGEKASFPEYREIAAGLAEFANTDEEREGFVTASNISDEELKSMKEQKAIMLGWLYAPIDQLTLRGILKRILRRE